MLLGKQIRELRKKRAMTLAEVAKKSGVALATLSRIETGKMTGTLESHVKIAKTFGMSIPEFYSEIEKPITVQNKEDYADVFVHDKKASSVILTKDIFAKKMLPALIKLQPGGKTHIEQLKRGAEKFIYVLQGKIEVTIGEARNELEKEATLYFDGFHPHYIRNIGTTNAECLCVVTPTTL